MDRTKENGSTMLPMTVTEGVTVNVLPNARHEYLMTTKEVANGYGTSDYAVRKQLLRHSEELIEGKHYVTAVEILNGAGTKCPRGLNLPHNATLWTKRGVVRLGFFIKSDRAKLFRDWAEELIIKVDELAAAQGTLLLQDPKVLPKKRLINRLDRNRMVRLLAMTAKIDNSELRNGIVNELMGGYDYDKDR